MSDTDSTTPFYVAMETAVDSPAAKPIPFKLVPELPLSSTSSFDIVAVVDNKDTVRVRWNALTANHISQTEDVPSAPGTTVGISYITLAADETGLYINDSSSWRKAPSYGANWGDLTEDTRFLLVNTPMSLDKDEVKNVRQSIQLDVATGTDLGLVKVLPTSTSAAQAESVKVNNDGLVVIDFATPIVEESPEGVPGVVRLKNYYSSAITGDGTYAVTEKYVREAINNYAENVTLPIATESSLGAIVVDSGTALTISASGTLSIKSATSENTGVVFLDEETDIDSAVDSHAASVGLVNTIVDRKIRGISTTIAGQDLGMVRVPGDTAITIDGVGNIDVRTATETAPGAVTVLGELKPGADYSGNTAVTPQAVTDYVESKFSNLTQSLPIATASELGAIRVGSSVTVNEDTGVLNIANATPTRLGGVYVALATNDINSSTVPTEGRVVELINSSTTSVGTAKIDRYGTVKLSLPDIINEGAKIGVNSYGQLVAEKTTISSGTIDGEVGIAESGVLGLVSLSSSHKISTASARPGLPIGSDVYGTIYVDSEASTATNSRLGLVKLGTQNVLSVNAPAVGMDAQGRLRLAGDADGGTSYYMYKTSKPADPVNLYYYEEGSYNMPFIYTATSAKRGAVLLGTDTVITGGTPVGVDSSGRLAVSINISGTSGGSGSLGTATATSSGVVKLSQDGVITGGLPVGVNANGQLVVASSSTNLTSATTSALGGVKLSVASIYQSGYGSIGLNNNNQIVVAPATETTPGVVKVGGGVVSDTYTLVGTTSDGKLAVSGSTSDTAASGAAAPLSIALIPTKTSGKYTVTMRGGAVQMNDGTIVNIDPITEEDAMTITPSNGQTLRLRVYINTDGEAKAKLYLVNDTKTLTCRPTLG